MTMYRLELSCGRQSSQGPPKALVALLGRNRACPSWEAGAAVPFALPLEKEGREGGQARGQSASGATVLPSVKWVPRGAAELGALREKSSGRHSNWGDACGDCWDLSSCWGSAPGDMAVCVRKQPGAGPP